MRYRPVLLIPPLLFASAALPAQAPPLGSEFQVNSYTTNFQGIPAVASAGNGSFVVVWTSIGQDGSGSGVFGQRYDSLGAKAGPEFQVNTYTTGSQESPSVAADRNGNFVVVWASDNYPSSQDGSMSGVFGQRFNSSGAKVGSEFAVNTYTTGSQASPSVGMDGDGNFTVVWASDGQDGSKSGVFGQRFNSSGARLGSEFQVNTDTTGDQKVPRIAMSDNGRFVVVWTAGGLSQDPDGSGYGVFGQRFDSSGAKAGAEFLVNTYTTSFQRFPGIAMDRRGNFIVAWESDGQAAPGADADVYGQRFDSSGNKLGPEFLVDTYTTGRQEAPAVAAVPDGGFVVVWQSQFEDGSGFGVFGRRFDRKGDPLGEEFPINTYTTDLQWGSAVASSGAEFVVAWESLGQDGSDYGVFGRRREFLPRQLAVDSASTSGTSSDTNGVLEPGENVLVQPLWSNDSAFFADLSGSTPLLFCFIGSPCVVAGDRFANYGTMPPNSFASCDDGSPDACYQVSAGGPRPGTHWDGGLAEFLSVGGGQLWTLHVGDSFADVPRSQPFYKKIETVLHNGITSGCNTTQYCPGNAVPRDQMAIFIAKAMTGSGTSVPTKGELSGVPFGSTYNCTAGGTSLFVDVTPTDSFCKHVHYLANQNVTLGCGNFHYCPGLTVTREEMASFIAKAVLAPGGGGAVPLTYGPDPITGLSYSCAAGAPNLHFTDVPASNAFCKHIHYLWARGFVSGCSATQYCPSQPVKRDAMAKFLANAFGLELYAP